MTFLLSSSSWLRKQPRSQGLSGAGEKENLVGAGHVSQSKQVDQGRGASLSTLCNFFFVQNEAHASYARE